MPRVVISLASRLSADEPGAARLSQVHHAPFGDSEELAGLAQGIGEEPHVPGELRHGLVELVPVQLHGPGVILRERCVDHGRSIPRVQAHEPGGRTARERKRQHQPDDRMHSHRSPLAPSPCPRDQARNTRRVQRDAEEAGFWGSDRRKVPRGHAHFFMWMTSRPQKRSKPSRAFRVGSRWRVGYAR